MGYSQHRSMARVRLMADVTSRISRAKELKARLSFIRKNPGACNIDDLDMLAELTGVQRRDYFKRAPAIHEMYKEFSDKTDIVLSSLHNFVRRAFPHCKLPGKWTDGKHVELLCKEWQEVIEGKHPRFLLNQPPASMKSVISNIMVPAFAWARDPNWSMVQYGYNDALPKRDNRVLLNLIRSDWYKRRFPHVRIRTASENEIQLTEGGYRLGFGWKGSGTGFHPNLIVIDDPTKAGDIVNKPKEVSSVVSWYSSTITTRGMGHEKSAVAIVMQRLAVNDLCGVILKEGVFGGTDEDDKISKELSDGFKWHHVCLPMFYDPDHPYLYPGDWRTEPGQILWPERFSTVDIKARMQEMEMDPENGGKTTAAQFGQNPLKTMGAMFNLKNCFITAADLPDNIHHARFIRAWDRADSTGGDSTAGVLMCELNDEYFILDVAAFQMGFAERDRIIERISKQDKAKYIYRAACEKAVGPDANQAFDLLFKRLLKHGIQTMAIPATKSKEHRAQPLAAAIKYGQVKILAGKDWESKFRDQMRLFPLASHDDMVDAAAHAFWALQRWKAGEV